MRQLKRYEKSRSYALYAFLWGILLAAVLVVPVMISDRGYFLYYGDFNVQQIPFYRLAHDSIRSGVTGWSHITDLGANFIGSYSFYLLGSPFFWLTILLPSGWVAYAMGPLLILKLGFCSLSAYIYLRRYVRDQRYAALGGILYAFSSFSVYNIFFFHFHEPMIIFPLLLAAMDEFHATKRRGVVALAVCASAVVNYYFFVGQVVFAAIYYVIKRICGVYRFQLREFLLLAFECVIGLLMSMFLLLPSIAAITGNYRVGELLNGWNTLIYPRTQRYIQILVSLFFPGDIPARNNFTASAGAKWSSVAAYLPMFSMIYVIAYLRQKKHTFFKIILSVLFLMALIPALNSVFQMLNSAYYARWFYMLTLMMAAVTVRSLEHIDEVQFMKGFIPTACITAGLTMFIGFVPEITTDDDGAKSLRYGLSNNRTLFFAFALLAIGGLVFSAAIYMLFRKKPGQMLRVTAIVLSLFVFGYGTIYLWTGKANADRDDDFLMSYALNDGADITLGDLSEVRSDFYETSDNMGMFWQAPTINAFHSIVPGALIDFYNKTGVTRDVASRPSKDVFGLRAFLSVKYLFAEEDSDFTEKGKTKMPYFDYLRTENGFDIYLNRAYVPMGFTFDRYITEEEYIDLNGIVKHLSLLKALVLTQEQMEKYADITGYTEGMYDALNASHDPDHPQNSTHPSYDGFKSITADFGYTDSDYLRDATELNANCCSSFSYTKDGFDAVFDNKGGDNLLFFSVPYDEGWTATVNGEPAEIEKVDIGFMAVRVNGHETSDIRFRYTTPLLKQGAIVSCIAAAGFILYLIINRGFGAKRKLRKQYRIKTETTSNGGIL